MRRAAVVVAALVLGFAVLVSLVDDDGVVAPSDVMLEAVAFASGTCGIPPIDRSTFRLERDEIVTVATCLHAEGRLSDSGLAFVKEPASDDWIEGSWEGEPGTSALTLRTEHSAATMVASERLSTPGFGFSGLTVLLAAVAAAVLLWWRRRLRAARL